MSDSASGYSDAERDILTRAKHRAEELEAALFVSSETMRGCSIPGARFSIYTLILEPQGLALFTFPAPLASDLAHTDRGAWREVAKSELSRWMLLHTDWMGTDVDPTTRVEMRGRRAHVLSSATVALSALLTPALVIAYARLLLRPDRHQIILRGAAGTGKSHLARLLARWIMATARSTDLPSLVDNRVAMGKQGIRCVQFHANYSYSDFLVCTDGPRWRVGILPSLLFTTPAAESGMLWGAEKPGRHILVADDVDRVASDVVMGEVVSLLENRGVGSGLTLACGYDFYLPDSFFLIATTSSRNGQVDRLLMERCAVIDVTQIGDEEPHTLLFRWLRITFWKVFSDSKHSQERQDALLCIKALRRANQVLDGTGAMIGHARFLQGSSLAQFVKFFDLAAAHTVMPALSDALTVSPENKAALLDAVKKILGRESMI